MPKRSRLVDHLKAGQDSPAFKWSAILFYHLKARLFCPILQYLSGFQMAKPKWPLPFESRTGLFSSASLDRFIQKIILFMTLFY